MVKIYVGLDDKIFFIHKRLLLEASPYLKAKLDQTPKTSIADEIRLPNQEPDLFNHFVEWLYSGTINISRTNGDARHDHIVWTVFTKLYLLAKYLQCTAFGNRILRAAPILPHPDRTPTRRPSLPAANIVKMVYDGTSERCGIRMYLVAIYVWMAERSYFEDQESLEFFATLPAEFVLGIAEFYIRGASNLDDPFEVRSGISVFYDE